MLKREGGKNLAEKKPCTNILNIYIKKKIVVCETEI